MNHRYPRKAKKEMTKRQLEESEDEISSEEEGEDLILEGVLVRNPEVESSSDEEEDDEGGDEDDAVGDKHVTKQGKESIVQKKKKVKFDNSTKEGNSNQKKEKNAKKSKKVKKKDDNEPEIINVEFTFNDMKEAYFHGMKNFLLNQIAYAPYSSELSDLIIRNISVGTVVSTEDGEDNVFGFASVLNITTFKDESSIKFLRKKFLESCPAAHKAEMETVLSGKTKRPAGILLHGRMVNLPLEITHVLHDQLVLDMDWAVDNAVGTKEDKKSFDFGAFVLVAPCVRDGASHSTIYKNFDDEIFAGCAEFVFPLDISGLKKKSEGGGNKTENDDGSLDHVDVVVLTKEGHRKAMKELKEMILAS